MSLFDTGIRPVVDKWLLEKSKEVRDYGDYWSASSAGYCMRKNIFERLKVPYVKEDARKQRVFAVGDIFHQWMQDITKNAGLSIAQELELQDEELMIRGHIDDLVLVDEPIVSNHTAGMVVSGNFVPKQHLILYDYKTQNSRAFSYKRDAMSHYHKMQLGTYMYMLRKLNYPIRAKYPDAKGSDLTEARILKISKDDLRMNEEQLLWTPGLEKEVVGYWRTLNGYWKAKKLPKCTCADYEGGFMAREAYNPYFMYNEPCSLQYYEEWKEGEHEKRV